MPQNKKTVYARKDGIYVNLPYFQVKYLTKNSVKLITGFTNPSDALNFARKIKYSKDMVLLATINFFYC